MPDVAPRTRILRGWLTDWSGIALVHWAHRLGQSGLYIGGDALPEAGGEHGVAIAGRLLPLGVERIETARLSSSRLWRGRAGRRTRASCRRGGRRGGRFLSGLMGKSQGHGDAGFGEAHQVPGEGNVTEDFKNRKEAGEAGVGDFVQDSDRAFFGMLPGDGRTGNWRKPRLPYMRFQCRTLSSG